MDKIQYLVTATGRCGTVYMARLLTSLGIMCGHESIFDHCGLEGARRRLVGIPDTSYVSERGWFDPSTQIAESSSSAAPFLDSDLLQNTKIIHVFRDPLKTISSYYDMHFFDNLTNTPWKIYLYKFMPDILSYKLEIERCCAYVVQWNLLITDKIADQPYLFYRIDKKEEHKLLEFVGNPDTSNMFRSNNTNARKQGFSNFTLKDIPCGQVKKDFVAMMDRYGYLTKIL